MASLIFNFMWSRINQEMGFWAYLWGVIMIYWDAISFRCVLDDTGREENVDNLQSLSASWL